MGIQQSQESQRFSQNFLQQYALVRDLNDPRFGEVQIYKSRTGSDLIMLKLCWCQSESEFKLGVAKCDRRTQVTHKNLLKLLGYHSNSNNQLCGDFQNLSIYYEYFDNTLDKQIEQRYNIKQGFSEPELWNYFEQLITACSYLEHNNLYVGDIRPINIMVDQSGTLKIAEHGLVQGDRTGLQRAQQIDDKAYLAPELLPFVKDSVSNPPVTQKSEVFSIGLTMLECTTLMSCKSLYQFRPTVTFDSNSCLQILNTAAQMGYSVTWYRMLREMLRDRPEERPSLEDINGILAPHRSAIQRLQPFSLTEQTQSSQIQPSPSQQQISTSQFNSSSQIYSHPPQYQMPAQIQYSHQPVPVQQVQVQPVQAVQPIQQVQQPVLVKQVPQQSLMQQQPSQSLLQQQAHFNNYPMTNMNVQLYSPQREEKQQYMLPAEERYIQPSPQKMQQQPQHYYQPQQQYYEQQMYLPQQQQQPLVQQSLASPLQQQPSQYFPTQQQSAYTPMNYHQQPPQQMPQSYQQQEPEMPNDSGLSDLDLRIQRALKSSQETANRHYQTPSYY